MPPTVDPIHRRPRTVNKDYSGLNRTASHYSSQGVSPPPIAFQEPKNEGTSTPIDQIQRNADLENVVSALLELRHAVVKNLATTTSLLNKKRSSSAAFGESSHSSVSCSRPLTQ